MMSKPTLEEWLKWAEDMRIQESVVQWVQDNPQVLQEIDTPEGVSPYVYPLMLCVVEDNEARMEDEAQFASYVNPPVRSKA